MKILLFNDNPVVRKLVALSAQKTKDELSVIWSVDEIQESDYDLLIIDDALYSDELLESLNELVSYKATLLMATRGKAVPAGFDNIINKPFLPTDLVDMFVKINKKTASVSSMSESVKSEEPFVDPAPSYAINLDDTLPEKRDTIELDSFDLDDEIDLGDSFDLDEETDTLTDIDDIRPTAILDQEEVQEVQNLLDDTESDDWNIEEEIIVKGIHEPDIHGAEPSSAFEEETISDSIEDFGDDLLSHDELVEEPEIVETKPQEDFGALEEGLSFDDLNLDLDDEMVLPNLDDEMLLDDEELGDLETQIQEAVDGLEAETLDKELELDALNLDFDDALSSLEELEEETIPEIDEDELDAVDEEIIAESGDFGTVDEWDMLSERDLKLAIGEEVEDEAEPEFEEDKDAEEVEESFVYESEKEVDAASIAPSHAEGVEALQALLKALSNEEVAKSLKGLNISININFGNEQ